MKKLTERLLIFFLGVPAIFALIFFLPFCRHLSLNIAVIIFSAFGAVEFSAMLKKKHLHISKIESFILGASAPLAATLVISFNLPVFIIPLILMTGAGWSLLSRIFSSQNELENVINRIVGCFSVMAYPGYFLFWIIIMNIWDNSGAVFLFLLIIFINDSSAWLIGNLFGANNRGIIPASPNKSIAGFIGGLLGSVLLSAGVAVFLPFVFELSSQLSVSNLIIKAIILGFCTSIFAVFGDLAASALKRSSSVKDSGNIILGRGGVLDTIDSISVAAPVFFLLYNVFFFIA